MSVFYDLNKTPRNILNQAIVRAIISENNGALFDPSDLSTLYQDAAGTIPATAVEQPVGKMLDKSGNGYHATQSITASRPTLSARYNLLTKTEDFSDAVWVKLNTTVSATTYQSPIDGRLADKIVESTSLSVHEVRSAALTIPANTPYTFTARLKAAGKSWAALWLDGVDGGGAYFDLINGVVGNKIYATASIINIGNGEYLCSVTVSLPSTNPRSPAIYVCSGNGVAIFTGDGVGGVYCFFADLRLGTTFSPYQRVNTSTDYDTDERYFKKYLRFDGVDDYLNLPYMGLYANGSASVVAAYNLRVTGYSEYLISERSSSTANPAYLLQRKNYSPSNLGNFIRNDAGTILADDNSTQLTPSPVAVISVVDSGSGLSTYVNSKIGGAVAYSRAGVLTPTNTIIGASVSTATGNFANMKVYGLIITKSALTDSQRVACERFEARKSGVLM